MTLSRRNALKLLGAGGALAAGHPVLAATQTPAAAPKPPSGVPPDHARRIEWWHEAKFGMFIHWGLYSVLGRHEWVMENEAIPVADYEPLASRFTPKPHAAREWAKLARAAGMKYMVMTTKHHEGFCLFDTRTTRYCAPKQAAGRDLVREYVDAARAEGLRVGFYYSLMDWHHPDGALADAAFRDGGGNPLLDIDELFYDGNSQGGIMGGALTALAPDFTKAVLGVPGMNYSTLLNRSVDWEGEFIDPEDPDIPAYASFNYNAYPDKVQQQLVFALLQMLWDRGEANGYAQHMTSDPYPNTPPHQVLLEVAFGDYQVTNHAAEVEARTIGADHLGTALAPGRHWERAVASGAAPAPFGLRPFAPDPETGEVLAPSGSALVYWDSGNPTPFNGNVPPAGLHQDPHGDPRSDPLALLQKRRFYATGDIVDVAAGQPYWTVRCPRHPDQNPGC